MRKVLAVFFAAFLMAAALATSGFAQEKKVPAAPKAPKAAKTTAPKAISWNGVVQRVGSDKKSLEVRKGTVTRTVVITVATQITKGAKAAAIDDIKDATHVIAKGTLNAKGQVEATRIDIRAQ
jgi:hypothetical protein